MTGKTKLSKNLGNGIVFWVNGTKFWVNGIFLFSGFEPLMNIKVTKNA
jgi:hypothetical protein